MRFIAVDDLSRGLRVKTFNQPVPIESASPLFAWDRKHKNHRQQ
jgi:hypothetical protein